jgi:hypothetical protein
MVSVRCRVCKYLSTYKNAYSIHGQAEIKDIQKEARLCQGGGCRMLLRAISIMWQSALHTDAPEFLILESEDALFNMQPYDPMQLFVTEGKEPFEY